jgi:hypothetical protein
LKGLLKGQGYNLAFAIKEALGQSWRLWLSQETEDDLYDDILEIVCTGQMWRGEVINQRKD